jgi:hypothetical protein
MEWEPAEEEGEEEGAANDKDKGNTAESGDREECPVAPQEIKENGENGGLVASASLLRVLTVTVGANTGIVCHFLLPPPPPPLPSCSRCVSFRVGENISLPTNQRMKNSRQPPSPRQSPHRRRCVRVPRARERRRCTDRLSKLGTIGLTSGFPTRLLCPLSPFTRAHLLRAAFSGGDIGAAQVKVRRHPSHSDPQLSSPTLLPTYSLSFFSSSSSSSV